MSRSDPGATTGLGEYPSDPPDCRRCRHRAGVHLIRRGGGGLGRCSHGDPSGPCTCRQYQLPEVTDGPT